MPTTGPQENPETYERTMQAGALHWGCYSIGPRKAAGNTLVGCYFAPDFDGPSGPPGTTDHHFAMCDHGTTSRSATSRKEAINLAINSDQWCDRCRAAAHQR